MRSWKRLFLLITMLTVLLGGGFVLSGGVMGAAESSEIVLPVIPVDPAAQQKDSSEMSTTERKQEKPIIDPTNLYLRQLLSKTPDSAWRLGRLLPRAPDFADLIEFKLLPDRSFAQYVNSNEIYTFFCEYLAGRLPVRAGPVC